MIPPDVHRIDGVDWRLIRAWPRDAGRIPLELAAEPGRVVGQWFVDVESAAREVRRTPGARLGDDPRLVLQPVGADRRLPGLAREVAAGGHLVTHRPGRRAVVRATDGTFLKFTRSGRAATLAERHRQLAVALAGTASVPEVLDVADDRLRLGAVAGRPVAEQRRLQGSDGSDATDAWHRLGAALAALWSAPLPPSLPEHDAGREAEVTRTWLERAITCGRLPAADVRCALGTLTTQASSMRVVSHRDLHDGQVLVHRGAIGLLDPDTLARAEPALDLANLLVHLELRTDQALLPPRDRDRARAAFLDGLSPSPEVWARVGDHVTVARLRLAAVYAFRPRWHLLARRWFDDTLDGRSDRWAC